MKTTDEKALRELIEFAVSAHNRIEEEGCDSSEDAERLRAIIKAVDPAAILSVGAHSYGEDEDCIAVSWASLVKERRRLPKRRKVS